MAVLVDGTPRNSALPYTSDNIHFIPLKRVGGKTISDKLAILGQIPSVLKVLRSTLTKVDVFQLRTPTGMGVYLIPYLTWFSKKNGWYKYAGNWKQVRPLLGFRLQRWMLKQQLRKVTINGVWEDQRAHCISFENPCLTEGRRVLGKKLVAEKRYDIPLNYCFVGAFYERKGIDKILEALNYVDPEKIGTFYFVGGGERRALYEAQAKDLKESTKFTGFISKKEIVEIYRKCHFIVLPSDNEGFPKVLGEAMNYGCVPIASNVSCIGQYIKHRQNGLLIEPNTSERLLEILNESFNLGADLFDQIIHINHAMAHKFTYAYYNNRLKNKVLVIE